MSKPLFALAFLAAAAAIPFAGAAAQDAPIVRVSHGDLDLARPADRRILDRRIASAAAKLCPALTNPGQATQSSVALRCRVDTAARAQLQRTRAVARATAATLTADSR